MKSITIIFLFLTTLAFSQQPCTLTDVDINVGQVNQTVIMDTQDTEDAIAYLWEIKVTRANGWTRLYYKLTNTNVFQHALIPQWNIVQLDAKCRTECIIDGMIMVGPWTAIETWQAP